MVRKAGNNDFAACRQLCVMHGTVEGSTGQFAQTIPYKSGSLVKNVEERLNEFLELVRRSDEANSIDPVSDQVKKACIISTRIHELIPGESRQMTVCPSNEGIDNDRKKWEWMRDPGDINLFQDESCEGREGT